MIKQLLNFSFVHYFIVRMSKRKGQFVSYFSRFFLWANLPLSFSKRKGQSSIIDAFLFVIICSSAAGLMIYTSGLYGLNNSKQVSMAYNFEFVNNALISMHYAQDNSGDFFWNRLSDLLGGDCSPPPIGFTTIDCQKNNVQNYLNGDAKDILGNFSSVSPSNHFVFNFNSYSNNFYCYPSSASGYTCNENLPSSYAKFKTVFSASSGLLDSSANNWVVSLKLYY